MRLKSILLIAGCLFFLIACSSKEQSSGTENSPEVLKTIKETIVIDSLTQELEEEVKELDHTMDELTKEFGN